MGKRKVMSEEEVRAILDRAMVAANEPLAQLDMDPLEFYEDLSSIPFVPSSAPLVPSPHKSMPLHGTHPVSIRVPVWVLQSFKEQAVKSGVSYQTLMNRCLRAGVTSFV